MISKTTFSIVCLLGLLLTSSSTGAAIYPQAGISTYFGPNELVSTTPWAGFRVPLSTNSSLTFRYSLQNIHYLYTSNIDEQTTIKNKISYFGPVFYLQEENYEWYAATYLVVGTGGYGGLNLDMGASYKLFSKIKLEAGFYLLRENTLLWYPDEDKRIINLYQVKFGLQYQITTKFNINSRVYLSRNTENVNSATYQVGLVYSPKHPYFFEVYYHRYNESLLYRFSGNYLTFAINIYL